MPRIYAAVEQRMRAAGLERHDITVHRDFENLRRNTMATVRTRKDVWKLPSSDETLLWYGRAVAEMKKRPFYGSDQLAISGGHSRLQTRLRSACQPR